MNKTPTELMKELKYIKQEINRLHMNNRVASVIPLNKEMEPTFEIEYSYESYRNTIKELQARELAIKSALAKFNSTTKAHGMDLTIAEALVRIGQLTDEIGSITEMANRTSYYIGNESYREGPINWKTQYNPSEVLEDLRGMQSELATLRMAVDRVNLTESVEF